MVLVVGREDVDGVVRALRDNGESVVYEIGEVVAKKGVELKGLDTWA